MNWMKKKEAAARLGISEGTLERLISSGKIPAYRMGAACIRLQETDVLAYLESCRVPVNVTPPAAKRRKAATGPSVCNYRPGDKVV